MEKIPKKLLIVSSASIIVIIALVLIFLFRVSDFLKEKPPAVKKEGIFKIYFSSEKDGFLEKEEIKGIEGKLEEKINYCIKNLINGPRSSGLYPTIPEGTKLVSVKLLNEYTAEITFSPEISESHTGGSEAEIQTIYSITNTVMMNFDEIKRVVIKIDGSNQATLAGHIDITKPFEIRKEIIKEESR